MKLEELMVGDIIFQHHPKDNTPHIVKVSVGTLDLMDKMKIGFIQEQSPLYRIIEPIHLTPEILEKNGFEWHNNEAKYFPNTWCCGELMLEPIVNGTLFLIVSRNDYDDEVTNYTPFTIKFVHELQHIIRLCGKEKEIEL